VADVGSVDNKTIIISLHGLGFGHPWQTLGQHESESFA
jgi:hypothetical protein